jgi:hypothetical protein
LTATAEAPIIRITETAAGMIFQQQMWTATAQSVQGTQVAAMTQTAMAWTSTPDATQTAVFALAAAEGTQIANQAERDFLQLERERSTNQFFADLPKLAAIVLSLSLAIVLVWKARRERFKAATVDARGNILPMFDLVDGTVTDPDRMPNYRGYLGDNLIDQMLRRKLNLPPLLPEVTAQRQDDTTQRDQLLDLASRGLPGPAQAQQSAQKRLAGQEMTKQLSASNLESRFKVLDGQTSNLDIIDGQIIQVLDQDWKEGEK